MTKRRILWCGEASYLETGYSKYARELLSRLHRTGKYEIAEFGCAGKVDDMRRFDIPWRFYGNLPATPEEAAEYGESRLNQFGSYRFNDVVLHFKPDIVLDIRDWWMNEHQQRSPYRDFFHWVLMPTVDSYPQQEQWMNTYMNADGVFAYSEFGGDVLKSQSGGNINYLGTAPPGADTANFFPVPDKREHKSNMGLSDVKIIGTVMRNQKRKLFPDLIQAFKLFMERYPKEAEDTYLYFHTSYPDTAWDMPLLVKESGIGRKILFTYVCRNCGHAFPSFFQDAKMPCSKCGHHQGFLPNHMVGVNEQQLGQIVNLFDLYVQYSICEGFGMPQVEAAACGVPVAAVEYSAMESVVHNLKGYPVQVERFFREPESHAYRAFPSNDHLAEIFHEHFSLAKPMQRKRGIDALMACRQHYDWDKTAAKWDSYLSTCEVNNRSWDDGPRIHQPVLNNVPMGASNDEFVKWCVVNVWGEPNMLESHLALRMIRDLNYGFYLASEEGYYHDLSKNTGNFEKFDKETALREFVALAEMRNEAEMVRCGMLPVRQTSTIQMMKEAHA